ncbi:MAG: hypothetical protein EBQ68_09930 [Betaproteobacteria bacterium]|nr:hypothetical protein [Betaproteobacteria bacterium]
MRSGFLLMFLAMWDLLATPQLAWATKQQPQLLYVTQANCKLIRGYSRNDLAGVAKAFGVPVDKVSFVKAEWSKGPEGRPQCHMVFNTPKGRAVCAVFSILKTDFVFGQAVPVKGNPAICLAPSSPRSWN